MERRNDTTLSSRDSDRQLFFSSLNRIADGIDVLTDEFRRFINDRAKNTVIDVNRTYSRDDAARILNVSTRTVDRRINDGSLHITKNNNKVSIDGASLIRHRTGVRMDGPRWIQKL